MVSKRAYFGCDCGAMEHTVRFAYVEDSDEPEVFIDVSLCTKPAWYKRVWLAIKYVFGYESQYGHYDEFIYKPIDVKRMVQFLNEFLAKEVGKHDG